MDITALCVYCKKNNSCTRCWKTNAKKCPYFNQKTNADHIRSMSDEELAKFIENIKARAAFCKVIGNNEAFEKLCSGEWLQQPMEEADNEAN